jgi:hypothetical protein
MLYILLLLCKYIIKMTQYTIDLFGWNFNYSFSDVSDVTTKIFVFNACYNTLFNLYDNILVQT